MSEAQGKSSRYPAGHLDAIEAAMSTDRLEPYILEAKSDKEKAMRLYERNTQLSEALYTPLQGVEIAVRNAFHKQLLRVFGDQWFHELDAKDILNPGTSPDIPATLLKLRAAREKLKREGKAETPGRLVAELSFGFLLGICATRHTAPLWIHCLSRPFKGKGLARAAVFLRLDDIRLLRNRVAHHEPILSRDLAGDHAKILETIRWICGATAHWVEINSCFPARFAAPLPPPSTPATPPASPA